ncbi:MAG: flagellar assembly peptidoglycan hydrolase FlgJ [Hydrogenophilales bacterium]|nr:flagellar assembly peptidoglycan hydrolase FlgJ [Hydrogenophilales bacterium]
MAYASVESLASDVRGAEALRFKASSGDPEALRAAAKQFESMFLGIVLKTMRETRFSAEDDPFANSSSLKLYQELLDQQWAQKMSAGRGLGFAEAMYAALSRNAAQPTSAADTTTPLAVSDTATASTPTANSAMSAETTSGTLDGRQTFVEALRPHAEKAAQTLGIPANFILAQAALETGWGKREIVAEDGGNSYNLFGIKAGPTWDGAVVEQVTTEYQQGLAVKKTQAFRVYSGYEAAFKDYAALLQRRYPQAAAAGAAADEFAAGLVAGGYATDPTYAVKVQRLIAQLA